MIAAGRVRERLGRGSTSFELLLALALVVATPGSGVWASSRPPDPRGVAGCYDVTLGPWLPAQELGADAAFVTPPRRVRLGPDQVAQPKSAQVTWRLLEPAPGVPRSPHAYRHWNFLDNGDLFLTWSTGFSGLNMVLVVKPDELVGTAETFWDFLRPSQTSKVRLTKVACEPSA